MTMIGHNQPSFDQIVEENLLRGLYLSQRDTLIAAARDPRCTQRHMRVLAEIIARINTSTGTAFPGRASLSKATKILPGGHVDEDSGYTESVIGKTISELIRFGYLVAEMRAPAAGKRHLSHYTIAKPSVEELQQQITDYIDQIRAREPKKIVIQLSESVTNGGNVSAASTLSTDSGPTQQEAPTNRPEETYVTTVGNDTTVGSATNGVPTVTSNKIIPPSDAGDGAPGNPASRKRSAKPRTRLPENWKPAPETVAWARETYVATDRQIEAEAEKFRDYHHSRGNTMADWPAAWRTWWGNGFHKLPKRMRQGLTPATGNSTNDALADAFERARLMDEEMARCRR